MYVSCRCVGVSHIDRKKPFATMEACCSRFTAAEGGARLAAVAAEKNTLAVEYSAFIATRLLHEDAYKIRGLLSKGYQRSVYVTRASKVACVAYELHILTDLSAVKALEPCEVEDWPLELEETQVLVCTSQVFQWILQEGILTIPQVNVLIIDSCHLIFEDQNLQYIMQRYKQCKESEQPRILALTYPLFTSGKDSEGNDNNINSPQDNTKKTATSNETGNLDTNGHTDKHIDKDESDAVVDISDKNVKDDDGYRIVEVYDEDDSKKDIDKIKDKDEEKDKSVETASTEKNLVTATNSEIDNQKEISDEKIDETKDKKSVDEIKDTKDKQVSESETDCLNECKDEKVGKEKNDDDDNLDDFDMYQKLEWKIEELEQALCCQMDLAEDIDGGKRLANTVAKPKEILVEYKPRGRLEAMPEAYVELERFMRDAVASAKAFIDEHRYDPTEIYGDELYEEFMSIPDPTIEPKLMFNQFLYVLDQLGPYAADKAAFCLLVKLEKLKIKVPYERHFLLLCLCTSVFIKIRCQADLILSKYDDWEKISLFSTPKVLRFAEILEQFQTSEQIAKARERNANVENKDIKDDSVASVDKGNGVRDRNDECVKNANDTVSSELCVENKDANEPTVANVDDNLKGNGVSTDKNDDETLRNDNNVSSHNNLCNDDIALNIKTEIIEHDSKNNSKNKELILDTSKTKDNNNMGDILENCTHSDTKNQIGTKVENLNENSNENALENYQEENQNDRNENKSTENAVSTHSEIETKLKRSKTMELLDELDKCDFVTLSNKIEDRVNTYEGNLKDLDNDIGDKLLKSEGDCDKMIDKVDKTEVDRTDSRGIVDKNEVVGTDNSGTVDKTERNEIDNVDKTKVEVDKGEKTEVDVIDKGDKTEVDRIDNDNNQISKDLKDTNTINNQKTKDEDEDLDIESKIQKDESKLVDSKNTNGVESKSKLIDKPDPRVSKLKMDERLLELRKQGFRRPHRVRGRGRSHRSHAARLQQMQMNPDALCGIVFVKEPLLAKIMFMMVVDMSRCRASLSHLCAQYCAGEGGDRPQGKKHEDVLKKFRMHECNLLLATSALEEGIDLPRCNLVVRWDLPPSYRSHGLCRSRARAPRSAVTLLAEAEAPSEALLDNLSVYKELDQIISRKCGCGIQNEPPAAEEVHADIFTPIVKAYTPVELNVKENDDNVLENKDSDMSNAEDDSMKENDGNILETKYCSIHIKEGDTMKEKVDFINKDSSISNAEIGGSDQENKENEDSSIFKTEDGETIKDIDGNVIENKESSINNTDVGIVEENSGNLLIKKDSSILNTEIGGNIIENNGNVIENKDFSMSNSEVSNNIDKLQINSDKTNDNSENINDAANVSDLTAMEFNDNDKVKVTCSKDKSDTDNVNITCSNDKSDNVKVNETCSNDKGDNDKVKVTCSDDKSDNVKVKVTCSDDKSDNDKVKVTCSDDKRDNDKVKVTCSKDESDNDKVKVTCSDDKNDKGSVVLRETVNGITKEVIRTEYIYKETGSNDKIDMNGLDNKINDKNNIDNESLIIQENNETDIPFEKNNDCGNDFNITYNLSKKSVCVCKSVCKCNSMNKSEVNKADKKEDGCCSVDLSTAIALINRYCGKLPSDTFTRLAPQYWMEAVQLPERRTGGLRTAYICTLRLPLNCPVKYNIVGHPMPTKVLARRMVALQACRILHRSGELDNQLMPIGKENFKAAELETVGQSDNENNDSARPGTTKRRQYYYKRTASAFTDCQPIIDSTDADIDKHKWRDVKESYKARFDADAVRNTLYALSSRLWCALPERYNTRGRRLHAPQHAPHAVAVLMAARRGQGLHIPAFPVYTRSGEVRVSIEPAAEADVRLSPRRAKLVRRFMRFVFSDVLRVRRRGMRLQTEGTTHNNYYIVPTVKVMSGDGTSHIDIDWSFLELIYRHTEEKKNSVEKPVLLQQDEEDEDEVVEKKVSRREREKDGKVKRMENPLLAPGEVFVFDADKYRDAVVTPWYRNQDQPQYFLVAEICWNLTPDSAFPSSTHGSFRDYYSAKYGVTLTQPHQPLLDVDHTSARLNLLTPRYVNRKGVALPVSSERTRRAKRDRLDQKQILVPELCTVHPFAAPLWFATVALPCVLYRINALLIADEIRRAVSEDVALGAPAGAPPPLWPPLDFGWSLAEVLNTDEKGDKSEKKKEEEDKKGEKEKQKEDKEQKEGIEDHEKTAEVKEKTINDILQEKEDAESGFEIGTWSNDMASSIPQEYDEFMEPLPPNLTFCTSASGGANWSDPIDKPKGPFGASKAFSMAESDCSYLSSDFDTDDSDLNSDASDEDTDSNGFCGKNTYAMGVRIEYKTAHEAEAVDLERKASGPGAPQPDAADDAADARAQRRLLRGGAPPPQYIEKYKKSIMKHKQNIKAGNLITKDKPIKDILPDNTKEIERLRKELNIKHYKIDNIAGYVKDKEIDKIKDVVLKPESISNEVIEEGSSDFDISKNENLIASETDLNNLDFGFINDNKDVISESNNTVLTKELSTEIDFNSEIEVDTLLKISNELNTVKDIQAPSKDIIDIQYIKISDEMRAVKDKEASTKDTNNGSPTASNDTKDKASIKDTDSHDSGTSNEKKDMETSTKHTVICSLTALNATKDKASIKDSNSHDSLSTTNDKKDKETSTKHTACSPTVSNDNEFAKDTDRPSAIDKANLNARLLDEIFPYGELELQDGQVTLESVEKNKRILLKYLKETLPNNDVKKLNCFSMLDIDIDSPDYINEKVVNVGFDSKDSYVDKVNAFRTAKEYTPYYQDKKVQNAKDFDFDYQPDLEGHPGPSPSVILQALTMSNANDGINLERLETIGDSFLKFAITAYLYCAHPAVHEGKLSHMRSKQVSNLNLYRLGRNKRLGARMIASKFEPHDNWLPPCHKPPPTHHPTSGDAEMQMQKEAATDNAGCFIPYNLITQHSIPDKSIADCVEALIGAYLLECGPRGALLFMSWLGISVLPRHQLPLPRDHPHAAAGHPQKPPATPSPKKSYSPPSTPDSSDSEECSWSSQSEPEPEPSMDSSCSWRGRPVGSLRPQRGERGWTQTIFGELRAPPSPLLRYVEDPEGELERMLSGYEALERTLHYRFRDRSLLLQALTHASHQQNRLTDCYQRLEFLGDAILDYLITRHLYEDARRHSPGALTDLRSALVNNTIFATLAARHGFHKYFRHMSPGLNEVLTKYVKIQEENGHSISEEHYLIQEDEMEQAEDVEVPKALGDLFESVAGAIFLDSGMSLGAVWASYVRLMGAELEAFSAAAPKSPVRELLEAEPDTAKFGKPERLADGRRVRVCVEVFGRGAFKGVGRNYRIAKGTAARCALRHLRAARPVRR